MKNAICMWKMLTYGTPLGPFAQSNGVSGVKDIEDMSGIEDAVAFLREWADSMEREYGEFGNEPTVPNRPRNSPVPEEHQ